MLIRVLSTFNIYFLLLMLFCGFIVGFIDFNHYNKSNLIHMGRKARIIGISSMIIGIILYLISVFSF